MLQKLALIILCIFTINCEVITFTISTNEADFVFNGAGFTNEDLTITLQYDTTTLIEDPINGGLRYENSLAIYTSIGAGFTDQTGSNFINLSMGISQEFGGGLSFFLPETVNFGIGNTNFNTNLAGDSNFEAGSISNFDGVSDFFASGVSTSNRIIDASIVDPATTVNLPIIDNFQTGEDFALSRLFGPFAGSGATVTFSAQLSVPEPNSFVIMSLIALILLLYQRSKARMSPQCPLK